ncbi:MAG: TonB-dependent receptor [Azonexaceae bacterium]|nr:TonB-dependent receptor [Azonexaceae bacterium]
MQSTKHPARLSILAGTIAGLIGSAPSWAADTASVFELGTVLVTGQATATGEIESEQVASVVTRKDMDSFNRENVGDAVNLLSGVSISTNSRNEKMVYVRGYDARQAPLFIDGIPVYVPYDGYVDMNRFTTADLSAIQVVKGFSSVAFGPNALGGAINLISRKPRKALEGDISAGIASGNERKAAFNVGTNQGMWYAQLGASYIESDYFKLSSDFAPTATEDGGRRENSSRQDSRVSLKLGLTPNATDEYSLSYYKQNGQKDQPPSTVPTARYWRWPYWDKESLYFVSKTALGGKETLKVRVFGDKFDNDLRIYSNNTYTTYNPVTGVSVYNDKSYGASVELSSVRLSHQEIKLYTLYKVDKHVNTNGAGATDESFKDILTSVALEDNIRFSPQWLLSLGLSHHSLRADHVYKSGWPAFDTSDKKTATNPQAALYFDLNDSTRFYASIAEKTRLPTLKDRFSLRFGNYVENPMLKAETSLNYEVGYQGTPWAGARAEAAVFHSRIDDKIQTVYQPGTANCSPATPCQMQNVGKVDSTGIELGLRTPIGNNLEIGSSYTYISFSNKSNPGMRITDIPRHKLTAFAIARLGSQVDFIPFVEYDSGRWASNTVKLDSFTTLNLKLAWRPLKDVTVEGGVNNVTDENYQLAYGFPNPGRNYFANVAYRF